MPVKSHSLYADLFLFAERSCEQGSARTRPESARSALREHGEDGEDDPLLTASTESPYPSGAGLGHAPIVAGPGLNRGFAAKPSTREAQASA